MELPNNVNVLKNFTCEICKKTFSTNNDKNQHISTVHGEVKIYACNVCTKTFNQKHELMSHIEKTHQPKYQKCKFFLQKFC